jgi:c-di-GMP-binding flagellar brake protein YcgR
LFGDTDSLQALGEEFSGGEAGLWVHDDFGPRVEEKRHRQTFAVVQMRTGGQLVSTTHRVVNGAHLNDRERLSMPFFLHPRAEVIVNPKTGLTAGKFLAERLQAIGVAEQGDKKN